MFNSNVVPLQDVGSPSLDALSLNYLTWDRYVSRSRHVQSLHLKAMVRSQLLRAIDTQGDTLCAIQEVLDLNVRPPAVGTDIPLSVSLDVVVNGSDMEALDEMKRGDVLVLTTMGKGVGGGQEEKQDFVPSDTFAGAKEGYDFKTGSKGVGYYRNGGQNGQNGQNGKEKNSNAMEVDDDEEEEEDDDHVEGAMDGSSPSSVDALAALVRTHAIGLTRLCVVRDVMDDEGTSLFDSKRRHKVVQGGRRTIRIELPAEQYNEDVNRTDISNYSFRHLMLGHRDVQVSYHILHHLKNSLSSSTSATVAAANASGSNGESNTKGSKFCVPAWLRETLVQGKILGNEGKGDDTADTDTVKDIASYDLGDTFHSMEQLQKYLAACGKEPTALNYEDEDDKEELQTKPSLFRTRLLLPSGTVQMYLSDAKKNTTTNHHHNYQATPLLDVQQLQSIVQTLKTKDQVTLIRGGPGTGKSECVVNIVAALSRGSTSERILVLTPTVGCVDRLLSKLERGKSIAPRKLIRIGGSGHGYGNFGPAGRREHCLTRQREILKEVSELSTSLGITASGTAFTCETAGHFYNVHVRPRVEQFEDALMQEQGANDPFAVHYQQKWGRSSGGGGGGGGGIDGSSEAVMARMERLTDLFVELNDYSPFEWMPFARLQMDYLTNSLSTIVGASIDGFVQEMDRYEGQGNSSSRNNKGGSQSDGPTFTTIVVDGASHMTDAALAVVLAYNRHRTTRVILTGDVRSSTVVPSSFSRLASEALYVGANMNMSLYERLSKECDSHPSGDSSSGGSSSGTHQHVHDLTVHHRSRDALSSVYRWRYGSSLETVPTNSKIKSKKQFANAGVMYPTQFVDVHEGQELLCPQGGYQNIQEAEYVVSMYQYLRLCGHSARSIAILTTYDDQTALIKDVMNLRCVDSPHFGKPSEVCTTEQYVGRECDIVLFSLVRTQAVPESIDSMPDLVNALSRARLGLYMFGHRALYQNSFHLTPALSKYSHITSQLCLVAGEKFPTKRGVEERAAVASVCTIENGLHMASVVRMMVGAPLLPGSMLKR